MELGVPQAGQGLRRQKVSRAGRREGVASRGLGGGSGGVGHVERRRGRQGCLQQNAESPGGLTSPVPRAVPTAAFTPSRRGGNSPSVAITASFVPRPFPTRKR